MAAGAQKNKMSKKVELMGEKDCEPLTYIQVQAGSHEGPK